MVINREERLKRSKEIKVKLKQSFSLLRGYTDEVTRNFYPDVSESKELAFLPGIVRELKSRKKEKFKREYKTYYERYRAQRGVFDFLLRERLFVQQWRKTKYFLKKEKRALIRRWNGPTLKFGRALKEALILMRGRKKEILNRRRKLRRRRSKRNRSLQGVSDKDWRSQNRELVNINSSRAKTAHTKNQKVINTPASTLPPVESASTERCRADFFPEIAGMFREKPKRTREEMLEILKVTSKWLKRS
jgi:hypothetical protein